MNRRRFLKTGAAVAGVTSLLGVGHALARSGNRYYQGPVSDHFDGTRFFNPNGAEPSGMTDFLRWQFGGGKSDWPDAWPDTAIKAVPDQRVSGSTLRVTMIGHASLLLQVDGLNILTDPVYSLRVSPVSFTGPKRINEPGVAFADLPPIDLVLVTHNHYDHLDVETLRRLKDAHDPLVVTPLGNDVIILEAVPGMRVQAQDWGDTTRIGMADISCEPAHHWSARGLWDRRMALWASFVIATSAGSIYHVGDTGFHDGINYRAVREKHPQGFRLANLPIGAYEPQWFMRYQHQNPVEAVRGMQLCGARNAVGHHWGSIQLTNEAVEQPRHDLFMALADADLSRDRFRPMLPGDVWDVP